MHKVVTFKCFIGESMASDLILNACRANEKRANWQNEQGFAVNFILLADGNHEAVLRNRSGIVIATAVVDEMDV